MNKLLTPVIVWDVDGVLNPHLPTDTYISYSYEDPRGAGASETSVVHLNPEHACWMTELTAGGAEHAWATAWEYLARTWIAPRLGHSPATEWPVIEVGPYGGVRFGHTLKFKPVSAFLGPDRPAFWIDDVFDGKDLHWAEDRSEQGVPTVIRHITSASGLSRDDIDAALDWLAEIRSSRQGQ